MIYAMRKAAERQTLKAERIARVYSAFLLYFRYLYFALSVLR